MLARARYPFLQPVRRVPRGIESARCFQTGAKKGQFAGHTTARPSSQQANLADMRENVIISSEHSFLLTEAIYAQTWRMLYAPHDLYAYTPTRARRRRQNRGGRSRRAARLRRQ